MLEVRVLGPTEVAVDGEPRVIGGPIPRALIVMLALQPRRAVPADVLIDTAWAGKPPSTGRHSLNVYVSSLRRTVAPAARIALSGQGFVLEPTEEAQIQVDAAEFAALSERARHAFERNDIGTARDTIDRALTLWRGRPFADLPDADAWAIESARLEALHRELLQTRAECRIATGDISGVAELETFAAQDAYGEATHMRLMRGLYLAGRQQDALTVYRSFARRLRDNLGLEPSTAMVALERAILTHGLGLGRSNERPSRSQPTFGREQLLADVSALLAGEARVVTLVGIGGVGKTTVAIAIADELAAEGQIVTWIGTDGLSSGDVPAWIARQITGSGTVDPYSIGLEHDRPRLIVVDAFEGHEEEAPYLELLTRSLPSSRIVITSRRPARLASEWLVKVPPLEASAAEALFTELIERNDRGALADEGLRETARTICRRLAGVPLALELAAARVGVLSVSELAESLDGSTLADVLDTTMRLLRPDSHDAFKAAGVFRSPFTPADIAAVSELDTSGVELSLRELYDAGLLVRAGGWTEPTSLRLLDPVREYAGELLRRDGLESVVRSRHLDLIVGRMKKLLDDWVEPARQDQTFARFERGIADFAAAVDYAVAEKRASDAAELVFGGSIFWTARSIREGLAWTDRLRDLEMNEADRLQFLRSRRMLLHWAHRLDEALEVAETILASPGATLRDRANHAPLHTDRGDPQTAIELFGPILAEVREGADTAMLLYVLFMLCQAHLLNGTVAEAVSVAAEAGSIVETHEVRPFSRAYIRLIQATTSIAAGDPRSAAAMVREPLAYGVSIDEANLTPDALLLVAELAISRGDEARGLAIAATANEVRARAGIDLATAHVAALPGARISALVSEPAELTLAEAVEQAQAVLDEILVED
jgi:DNA-binding SARP family transcriptional activator/predicted ATPase